MSEQDEVSTPFTPAEVEQIMEGVDEGTMCKVFCVDGAVVEVLFREAIKRFPFDVMPMQPLMKTAITAAGGEAQFLSPLTSQMMLNPVCGGIPGARVLENINKVTCNTVAVALGHAEVYGEKDDGVLKYPTLEQQQEQDAKWAKDHGLL